MVRFILAALVLIGSLGAARADFFVTGNPATDGWLYGGHSLAAGNYVRSSPAGASFSYDMYHCEFVINTVGPLTASGWQAGNRVVGMGGVFTPGTFTPTDLGWPDGTVFNGGQNFAAANTRVIAKFGTNTDGPGGNIFEASTIAPNQGNGLGSFSAGNGGLGSVQVSIASRRFDAANANTLITPTTIIGGAVITPDSVVQYVGGNLSLQVGNFFPSARYMYTVDSNGFLASWEVLLNTTMVEAFAGALPSVPTGGLNWVQSVQQGTTFATDGLVQTEPFPGIPAPPTLFLALGGSGLLLTFRRRFGR